MITLGPIAISATPIVCTCIGYQLLVSMKICPIHGAAGPGLPPFSLCIYLPGLWAHAALGMLLRRGMKSKAQYRRTLILFQVFSLLSAHLQSCNLQDLLIHHMALHIDASTGEDGSTP